MNLMCFIVSRSSLGNFSDGVPSVKDLSNIRSHMQEFMNDSSRDTQLFVYEITICRLHL